MVVPTNGIICPKPLNLSVIVLNPTAKFDIWPIVFTISAFCAIVPNVVTVSVSLPMNSPVMTLSLVSSNNVPSLKAWFNRRVLSAIFCNFSLAISAVVIWLVCFFTNSFISSAEASCSFNFPTSSSTERFNVSAPNPYFLINFCFSSICPKLRTSMFNRSAICCLANKLVSNSPPWVVNNRFIKSACFAESPINVASRYFAVKLSPSCVNNRLPVNNWYSNSLPTDSSIFKNPSPVLCKSATDIPNCLAFITAIDKLPPNLPYCNLKSEPNAAISLVISGKTPTIPPSSKYLANSAADANTSFEDLPCIAANDK